MSLTLHIKLDFVLVCYNFIHIRKYNLLFLESRNAEVQGLLFLHLKLSSPREMRAKSQQEEAGEKPESMDA